MKRTLIVLVVGLLAVGCLTPEEKQKRLRDSVVGEYEIKHKGDTYKDDFLDNGVNVNYKNGKRGREDRWKIVNKEIHVSRTTGLFSSYIYVYRINRNRSITHIADIINGKRTAIKRNQIGKGHWSIGVTYKKTK